MKKPADKGPSAADAQRKSPPVKYDPQTHEGLAEFLKSWVALLVDDPEHDDADLWTGKLDTLIADLLEEGADAVLALALQKAAVYNPFAVHELQSHIEDAATHPLVRYQGAQHAGALMAVPVLISESALPPDGMVMNPSALQALGESLKQRQLVPPESHVLAAAHLYQEDELLSMTPSQVLRLPQRLIDQACSSSGSGNLSRTGSPPAPLCDRIAGEKKPGTQLRYLVLTVVSGGPAEIPFRPSRRADDARNSLVKDWRAAADLLVAKALGAEPDEIQVVGFDSFHEGLRHGSKTLQDRRLLARLDALLAAANLSPKAVTAIIAAYMVEFEFKEVRLSLVSKLSRTLLTGEIYPVIDDPAAYEAVGRMKSVLSVLGIEDLTIVPMPLPMEQPKPGQKDIERVFLMVGKTTQEIAAAHAKDARFATFSFPSTSPPDEPEPGDAPPRKLH